MQYGPSLESRILELLSASPTGMTISEISNNLKMSRNTTAKYLRTLEVTGDVVFRRVSSAKLYFPAKRIKTTRLIDVFTEPMLVADENYEVLKANIAFQRLVGCGEMVLRGRHLRDIVAGDKWRTVEGILNHKKGRRIPFALALDILTPDGYTKVMTMVRPITLGDGRRGLGLIVRNGLEVRSRTIRDSSEIGKIFRALLNAHPGSLAIIDMESESTVFVNREFVAWAERLQERSNATWAENPFLSVMGWSRATDIPWRPQLDETPALVLWFVTSAHHTFPMVISRVIEAESKKLLVIRAAPGAVAGDKFHEVSLSRHLMSFVAHAVSAFGNPLNHDSTTGSTVAVITRSLGDDIVFVGRFHDAERFIEPLFLWASENIMEEGVQVWPRRDERRRVDLSSSDSVVEWLVSSVSILHNMVGRAVAERMSEFRSSYAIILDSTPSSTCFAMACRLDGSSPASTTIDLLRSLGSVVIGNR
ncbi:MAG: hypothetical protein DRO93_08715 [Candidatus Thorarchaeota archaeon]|nr:MAG: hypothetical protein DRO93_08715 [Candidatus Thorarchaeota archaeon]